MHLGVWKSARVARLGTNLPLSTDFSRTRLQQFQGAAYCGFLWKLAFSVSGTRAARRAGSRSVPGTKLFFRGATTPVIIPRTYQDNTLKTGLHALCSRWAARPHPPTAPSSLGKVLGYLLVSGGAPNGNPKSGATWPSQAPLLFQSPGAFEAKSNGALQTWPGDPG